ncbi:MAG: hypothetical protein A2X86_19075 [Bdellovibrionales bacterium GWA2_49_15]|nr:MAG: hypothetical protein A2X86_19075 [Bdellovibrionales bacterium GWA2_49_15]HAZ14330.1 hypothetical protein [Bdellovibrionales bacterium]
MKARELVPISEMSTGVFYRPRGRTTNRPYNPPMTKILLFIIISLLLSSLAFADKTAFPIISGSGPKALRLLSKVDGETYTRQITDLKEVIGLCQEADRSRREEGPSNAMTELQDRILVILDEKQRTFNQAIGEQKYKMILSILVWKNPTTFIKNANGELDLLQDYIRAERFQEVAKILKPLISEL